MSGDHGQALVPHVAIDKGAVSPFVPTYGGSRELPTADLSGGIRFTIAAGAILLRASSK